MLDLTKPPATLKPGLSREATKFLTDMVQRELDIYQAQARPLRQ